MVDSSVPSSSSASSSSSPSSASPSSSSSSSEGAASFEAGLLLEIDPAAPPSGTGCLECEQTGSWWLHLRRCAVCGHIGCCDDSLNRHGTAHWRSTGHRFMQSFEPGEDWFWDFDSETAFDGPVLAAPHSHPAAQTVPGPRERVPGRWQQILGERQD